MNKQVNVGKDRGRVIHGGLGGTQSWDLNVSPYCLAMTKSVSVAANFGSTSTLLQFCFDPFRSSSQLKASLQTRMSAAMLGMSLGPREGAQVNGTEFLPSGDTSMLRCEHGNSHSPGTWDLDAGMDAEEGLFNTQDSHLVDHSCLLELHGSFGLTWHCWVIYCIEFRAREFWDHSNQIFSFTDEENWGPEGESHK